MSRKTQVAEVRDALLGANRLLLLSHHNPDGDAIGSSLALAAGLAAAGKQADVCNLDGVPVNLAWLPLAERVRLRPDEAAAYDALVLLDCGSPQRTGFDPALLARIPSTINIDHHPGNGDFCHANLVDPEACATAELVWDVLQTLTAPVGYTAAVSIYTAILTDTGSFRFSNTNARAFEIASQMVARGVSPPLVAQMIYDQQPIGRLRLLSRALETLELSPRDKAASLLVTQAMFRETHTGVEDVEGFVNHPRSLFGVEVGFLLREEAADRYRVALRSKGRVDVSRIAQEFGGGGHRNAAGATLAGTPETIRRWLYDRVEGALDDDLLQRAELA